jgi:hypothetical protein
MVLSAAGFEVVAVATEKRDLLFCMPYNADIYNEHIDSIIRVEK